MATAAGTPRRTWRPRINVQREQLAQLAFVAVAVVAFAYILRKAHGNTFYYDEWAWIENKRSGLHALFASDNNHLLLLQTALYQLLFHTVGLNHYWVFRAIEAAAHIICVTSVFVFARRRIGAPAALIAVVPLAFLGVGWQFILWGAAGSGFLLSLALSVAALLFLEREDRRGDVIACALLVFALAWSDYTLAFLVGVAVELLWRRRRLTYVWIWGIPVALYAIWWLGHHQASSIRDNLTSAPGFALDSMAASVGGLFGLGLEWGRPLAVAGLIALGWRISRPGGITARLAAVLVSAGAFWLLLGLGRAQVAPPDASRYVYAGAIFVVLIMAETLRGVVLPARALSIGALLAIFAVAGGVRAFDGGAHELNTSSRFIGSELGALQIAQATAPPGLVVDPHYAPALTAGPYFAAARDLGSSAAYIPTQILDQPEYIRTAADSTLVQAGSLRTGPRVAVPGGAAFPAVDGSILGTTRQVGGCVSFSSHGAGAALDLFLPAGGLEVEAGAGPPVEIFARAFASGYEGAPVATLAGGGAVVLHSDVARSQLPWRIRVSPRQAVRACGLA